MTILKVFVLAHSLNTTGVSVNLYQNKYLLAIHVEKEMATHSSVLAWRVPETEELDGVAQSQTRLKRLSSSSSGTADNYRRTVKSLGCELELLTEAPLIILI